MSNTKKLALQAILVAAALAIVVSAIRRRWYREYGSVLEALCTEVLELTKKGEAR